MTLIDGKKVADQIKEEIGATVEKMVAEGKKRPHLAAILVGHDGEARHTWPTRCAPASSVALSRHLSALKTM